MTDSLPTTLDDWLAHCERIHPKLAPMPLERVQEVRVRLGLDFGDTVVITVAGTNGKGSTCAMLESIARQAGYRTGLYIKPHLVRFEERCRIEGEMIDGDALLPHFEAVERARRGVELTWFGFTTLVVLSALAAAKLDVVILEVGMGGRLDAVNAIDPDCSVITSVDLDHMQILGPDRETIGADKAHVMRPGRPAIVSDPLPPKSVVAHGERIGADLWLVGRDFNHSGDRQQWNWAGRGRRYSGMAYPALRGANQLLNASGAVAAFEALRARLPVSAQAIRTGLALVDLPGRFQILPGSPTLVLDVAHNAQSIAALAVNLDAMGFYPRTHAVFGAMRDKDIAGFLPRIVPLVDVWHCTDLATPRAATAAELADAVRAASGARAMQAESGASAVRAASGDRAIEVRTHGDVASAMRAAAAGAEPADRIVVFGSFYTVGGVLKSGLPRTSAPHLRS